MVFQVGSADLLGYIADGGLEWTENDIDSANAGRTMDGTMHRGRVATKVTLQVTFRPLSDSEATTVLTALYPEYVDVVYTDPRLGQVTKSFYNSERPASVLTVYSDGSAKWTGIQCKLIER